MSNFDLAFNYTMDWEGGSRCTHDPADPGGTTKFGLSARYNPGVDIENLDEDAAKKIYQEKYWEPYHLEDIVNPVMAIKLFDSIVNPGPGAAIKLAQQASNENGHRLAADGNLGLATIASLNSLDATAWVKSFCALLSSWYEARPDSPIKTQDLHGWLRRANSVPSVEGC